MKIAVIAFTSKGEEVATKISKELKESILYLNKDYSNGVKSRMKEIFEGYKKVIFVSAVGIAVRMISPYLKDKTEDPAIVAVDDMGRYAISLLSGHIGGANELANEVAVAIGAQPIITTASEGRGIEAIDMFAKRCKLLIEDMEAAKKLTSIMVNAGKIYFKSEINEKIMYDKLANEDYEGVIYVTSRLNLESSKPLCILRPKNIVVGIGCRRGKNKEEILKAISEVFGAHNLSQKSIALIVSIDVKKDEQGLIEVSEMIGCKFDIFSKEEIRGVQDRFSKSSFVEAKIGVTSVCEPCVYLTGADLIVPKTCLNGITVAVGRME